MHTTLFTSNDKRERYNEAYAQIIAVTAGESDVVANMANTIAILRHAIGAASWVGFYVLRGDTLVLGPFWGEVACVRIPVAPRARGVCGAAVVTRAVQVVRDVHAFADHIACDANTQSEIVVPIETASGVVAVLDVDSHQVGAFDDVDVVGLLPVARLCAEWNW